MPAGSTAYGSQRARQQCLCARGCRWSSAILTASATRHRVRQLHAQWVGASAGCVAGRAQTWLLMEFCDRGSLSDMVRANRFRHKPDGEPDMSAILRCLIDVVAGARPPLPWQSACKLSYSWWRQR